MCGLFLRIYDFFIRKKHKEKFRIEFYVGSPGTGMSLHTVQYSEFMERLIPKNKKEEKEDNE